MHVRVGVQVSSDGSAARYNYWSVHTDRHTNILYPFHPWEEENSLHWRLHDLRALVRRFPPNLEANAVSCGGRCGQERGGGEGEL